MADFTLRTLTPDAAAIVARHRAAMFHEMGDLAAGDVESLVVAATDYLRAAIASGEYHGWLATPTASAPAADEEAPIVGGAGIQLRPQLPRPRPNRGGLLIGRQGIILNVFVEPPFRRQGLARQLVEAAVDWARRERLTSIVLHASSAGRPLYERLGFVATNEMRYSGDLDED